VQLQIFRERVKAGSEADYRAVEEAAARICAQHRFPNPHLAMEAESGPHEVWWLNAFASEEARQRVTADYEANAELVRALTEHGRRKQGLTEAPIDVVTTYRPDLSRKPWDPAGARFFVVRIAERELSSEGSVFEAPDGGFYALTPTRTHGDAANAAAVEPGAMVFAVRPSWGRPAKEWIAADPEFWEANPTASAK
jgi:acetyl esterase/lipase